MKMNALRSTIASSAVLLAGVAAGCDADPPQPPFGALAITTDAPAFAAPTMTSDGWAITWKHFDVVVSAVTVAGDDQVVTASATAQIIDQVDPSQKPLVAAGVRIARAWEDVSLEIGPLAADTAAEDVTLVAPVVDADRDRMVQGGFSIYLEATATKGDVTKTLALGLTTDTTDGNCQETTNGVALRGLVVPEGGTDTANVTMDGTVLFSDDLTAVGANLRADVIMGADADGDGTVTMAELHDVTLDAARQSTGATYSVGDSTAVQDLGNFVEALSRSIVRTFRTTGSCTATPVVNPDDTAAAAAPPPYAGP